MTYKPTELEIIEAEKVVPHGQYCYTIKEIIHSEPGFRIIQNICPYWGKDKSLPAQLNGTCSFLRTNDTELEGGLLWDQVKECSINTNYTEE